MKMSELVDEYLANRGAKAENLARALANTGPLIHRGQYYTASLTPTGHTLQTGTKVIAGARQAAAVDVPEGSYPGVDAEQDALRGRAVALKANTVRILDAIDQALGTVAGKGGVPAVLAALKAAEVNAAGENIDGLHALTSAIDTVQRAATELSEIIARHKNSN